MFLNNFKKSLIIKTYLTVLLSFIIGYTTADNEECHKTITEGVSKAYETHSQTHKTAKDLAQLDVRYDTLPEKCIQAKLPRDCAEATACTQRSGIYKLEFPPYSFEPFYVECDAETEYGDWLLIQRRHDGSQDFFRNWEDYENGFGDVDKEFFIGLKKLYALTNFNGPQELMIVMEDVNATRAYAKYDTFAIGNVTEQYKLKSIGRYTGTAGDSLIYHLDMKFTTKDRDNDTEGNLNCATRFTGAWWYKGCHTSNLNGKYADASYAKGINWKSFRGHNASLKYTKMMIRRRRSSI